MSVSLLWYDWLSDYELETYLYLLSVRQSITIHLAKCLSKVLILEQVIRHFTNCHNVAGCSYNGTSFGEISQDLVNECSDYEQVFPGV
jgi:hypothetical protein